MIYELRYGQTEIIEFLKKNTQKILKKTPENGSIYVGKYSKNPVGSDPMGSEPHWEVILKFQKDIRDK